MVPLSLPVADSCRESGADFSFLCKLVSWLLLDWIRGGGMKIKLGLDCGIWKVTGIAIKKGMSMPPSSAEDTISE